MRELSVSVRSVELRKNRKIFMIMASLGKVFRGTFGCASVHLRMLRSHPTCAGRRHLSRTSKIVDNLNRLQTFKVATVRPIREFVMINEKKKIHDLSLLFTTRRRNCAFVCAHDDWCFEQYSFLIRRECSLSAKRFSRIFVFSIL